MGADFRARKQRKGPDFRMRAIEVIAVGTDRNQYSGLSVPMPAKCAMNSMINVFDIHLHVQSFRNY